MREIDLKNYRTYIESLKLFAHYFGIKIKYVSNADQEGIWCPSINTIKIDEDLSQPDTVASILHELGHAIDDLNRTPAQENRLYKAYDAVYNDRGTKSQLKLVIDCETRAWNYGEKLAKRLKIRLGKWYYDMVKSCLRSYKNS